MRLSRANIPLASEDRTHSQAISPSPHYNLAPHFWPGFINLQHFCHSRWRNPGRLSKSGHIGRRTSDPAIRRMTTTPYRYLVFYEITQTEIIIHAVRHAARDPSGMPGSACGVMAEPSYAPHQLAELQEGYYAV